MVGDAVTEMCVEFVKEVMCSSAVIVTFVVFGAFVAMKVDRSVWVESSGVGDVVRLMPADSVKPCGDTVKTVKEEIILLSECTVQIGCVFIL